MLISLALILALFELVAAATPQPLTISIPLRIDGRRYVADVDMPPGSTAQHFGLVVSTSSIYNVVPALGCKSCNGTALYNITASSSARLLQSNASVDMYDGSASGTLLKEDCSLKQTDGTPWRYVNQTFILANVSSLPTTASTQGILGFDLDRGNGTSNAFFANYFAKKKNETSVTLSFALKPTKPGATDGGEMHWVTPDSSYYNGNLNPVQVVPPDPYDDQPFSSWAINMDGWEFKTRDSNIEHTSQFVAYVDPYYPDLYLPFNEAQSIYSKVSGSATQVQGIYTRWSVPCDADMSFSLAFQKKSYILEDSVLIYSEGKTCYGSVAAWSDPNIGGYLLGSAFVSSVYTVFNVSQVGPNSIAFGYRKQTSSNKTTVTILAVALSISAVAVIAISGAFFLYRRKQKRRAKAHGFPSSLILPDRSKGDEGTSLLVSSAASSSWPSEPQSASGWTPTGPRSQSSWPPESSEDYYGNSQRSTRHEGSFGSSLEYALEPLSTEEAADVGSPRTFSIERNEGNLGIHAIHGHRASDQASSSSRGRRGTQDLYIEPFVESSSSHATERQQARINKQLAHAQQQRETDDSDRLVPLILPSVLPSTSSQSVAVSDEALPGYSNDDASPGRTPRREKFGLDGPSP